MGRKRACLYDKLFECLAVDSEFLSTYKSHRVRCTLLGRMGIELSTYNWAQFLLYTDHLSARDSLDGLQDLIEILHLSFDLSFAFLRRVSNILGSRQKQYKSIALATNQP